MPLATSGSAGADRMRGRGSASCTTMPGLKSDASASASSSVPARRENAPDCLEHGYLCASEHLEVLWSRASGWCKHAYLR